MLRVTTVLLNNWENYFCVDPLQQIAVIQFYVVLFRTEAIFKWFIMVRIIVHFKTTKPPLEEWLSKLVIHLILVLEIRKSIF